MEYQQRQDLRTVLQIGFWVSVLLLALVASRGVLAIGTIDAPALVYEGNLLTVSFSSDTNSSITLKKNGAAIATASPYTWQTAFSDAGLYSFTLFEGGVQVDEASVEVLDKPLSFTIEEPAQSEYQQNVIPVRLVSDSSADFCYYVLGTESNTLVASGNIHTGEISRPDGVYTITFKCKRGSEVTEKQVTLMVDSTAPIITQSSPAANAKIDGDSLTLSLTTSEVASCEYWRAGQLENRVALTTDDRLLHTALLTPGEGTHNYYVSCSDAYKNTGVPLLFTFTLSELPTARIDLENYKETPLPAGSYEVIMTTSKPIDNPTLTYEYQGGGGDEIALRRESDTQWRGYLVVASNAGEKAGSFVVKLPDGDVVGAQISEGKLFLIDTLAPADVTGLKAITTNTNGKNIVRLSWLKENDLTYNIYRSTSERVTRADFIEEVANDYYDDLSAKEGGTYFYAISAVDAAGNLGPLSREVVIGLKPGTPLLDADPLYDFETQKVSERLTKALLDLKTAQSTLESETDEQKLLIINKADLIGSISKLYARLSAFETDLLSLRTADLSNDEFESRIRKINDEISLANTVIPARIFIDGSIAFDQPSDTSAISSALSDTALIFGERAKELESGRARSAYQDSVQDLMDSSTISGKVVSATITFADRREKSYTYIEKQIKAPKSNTDIIVLENIPKSVASEASSLSWNPEPLILKEDPLVQYTLPAGETALDISYLIPQKVDLALARSVRSILLPPLPSSETNILTGNVVSSLTITKYHWSYLLGAIIIAGLLVYYFLLDSPRDDSLEKLSRTLQAALAPRREASASYFARKPLEKPFFKRRSLGTRARASLQPIQKPNESSQPKSVSALLLKGHQAINEKEYIPAKLCYMDALSELDDAPEHHRASANLLYYKLLLHRRMQGAINAAENKDKRLLDNYLAELQDIAARLPETQTPLIADAKQTYRVLLKEANKLAINESL